MKKIWLIMAIMLVASLALVGCKNGSTDKVEITFRAGDGAFPDGLSSKTVTINKGGKVTPPEGVALAGHTFVEWNTSAIGAGDALEANTSHSADTIYYAIWDEIIVEVPLGSMFVMAGSTKIEDIEVKVSMSGSSARGTITHFEDNTGYRFAGTGAGHRGKYAWFEIDFGAKKLSDYKEIKFDFEVISSTDADRRIALIASTIPIGTASLGTHDNGGSNIVANPYGSDYGFLAAGQVTEPMGTTALLNTETPKEITFKIVPSVSMFEVQELLAADSKPPFTDPLAANALNASKVYLSIYEHTEANAVIEVSNIRFIEYDVGECAFCGITCGCDAVITTVKGLIEAATFESTIPIETGTVDHARADVEAIIAELALDNVSVTVIDGAFTAAIIGTPGSYNFTVNLNRGNGTQQTTDSRTLVITYSNWVDVTVFKLSTWLLGHKGLPTPYSAFADYTFQPFGGSMTMTELEAGTSVKRISSSTSGYRPVKTVSGTDTNTLVTVVDGVAPYLDLRLSNNGGGFEFMVGTDHANNLNLDLVNNMYEFRVVGNVISLGGTTLRIRYENFDSTTTLNQTVTAAGPMDITIPSLPAPQNGINPTAVNHTIRFSPAASGSTNAGAAPTCFHFTITEIEIINKGPRP